MTPNDLRKFAALAGILTILLSVDALAQSGSFAKLQFGEAISLEAPRNWTYLSEQVRQHLKTGSEAIGQFPVRRDRHWGQQAGCASLLPHYERSCFQINQQRDITPRRAFFCFYISTRRLG